MKKTYVELLLEVVVLTNDVVTSSRLGVYEDEQPDFSYSNSAWGGQS